MKFRNEYVSNFEGAFRGLRNPLESWSRSDSEFGITTINSSLDFEVAERWKNKNENDNLLDRAEWLRANGILKWGDNDSFEFAYLGPNDIDLAQRMIAAGTSDSKFLRQIFVSIDITAPLYWWKEFDTYKIGTTANSTSTMHKLASTSISLKNFETDDFNPNLVLQEEVTSDSVLDYFAEDFAKDIIKGLETLRLKYLETKDERYWKELVRWLPNGWIQTRTVTMNYAVLRNIYFQRKNHRLNEWHSFCNWIKELPYGKELIILTK